MGILDKGARIAGAVAAVEARKRLNGAAPASLAGPKPYEASVAGVACAAGQRV